MAIKSSSVRRRLLRPLHHSEGQTKISAKYKEALNTLDELVVGEVRLEKLVSELRENGKEGERTDFRDPVRARKFVELSRALFNSRRITFEEYVFYSLVPLESVHKSRLSKGVYDPDLKPLSDAIE